MDDRELVKRTLQGDKKAFEELVMKYERKIYNYVLKMVADRELAIDIAQDTFLKAYAALDSNNPKFSFSTWIFRIAHNLVVDYFRKTSRYEVVPLYIKDEEEEIRLQLEADVKGPDVLFSEKERNEIIKETLEKLPPDLKELIILRHLNELSYNEISEVTGLSISSVKSKLHKAREMLRRLLERYYGAL